jgi:hypothetical protein
MLYLKYGTTRGLTLEIGCLIDCRGVGPLNAQPSIQYNLIYKAWQHFRGPSCLHFCTRRNDGGCRFLQNIFQPTYTNVCAIAQVVSRRLSTEAAGVQSQVRLCGICGGQSGAGAGFLRVPQFPLPIL